LGRKSKTPGASRGLAGLGIRLGLNGGIMQQLDSEVKKILRKLRAIDQGRFNLEVKRNLLKERLQNIEGIRSIQKTMEVDYATSDN